MRRGRRLLPLLLILSWSCGPSEGEGPFRVAVLELDEDARSWSLAPATIETAEPLSEVRGEATTLLGGAKLVLDEEKFIDEILSDRAETVEDLRDLMVKREGRSPRLTFAEAVVSGEPDVLVPLDFHGLALVTAYYWIEACRRLAISLGMPPTCLTGLDAYYETHFTEVEFGMRERVRTNAFFSPLLEAMILVPYELDDLPLGMNPGVLGHEYGHGIWYCMVDETMWPGPSVLLDQASQRHLLSVEEGLADFFGGLVSSAPDFIVASIPWWEGRDMASEWVYTNEMRRDADSGEGHDPYAAGAVLASALWEIGGTHGDLEAIGRSVLLSMEVLGQRIIHSVTTGRSMSMLDYLDALVHAISMEAPAARDIACNVLTVRFAAAGTISECS